jgi:hypothetical protein
METRRGTGRRFGVCSGVISYGDFRLPLFPLSLTPTSTGHIAW